MIEPGPVVIAGGLHDEGISVPMSHRVSIPGRVRIFWQWPPVRPDRAPQIVVLHVLQQSVVRLYEFKSSEIRLPQVARKAHRFTRLDRTVPQSWGNQARPEPPLEYS